MWMVTRVPADRCITVHTECGVLNPQCCTSPPSLGCVFALENADRAPVATYGFAQSSETIRSPRLQRIGGLGWRRREIRVAASQSDAQVPEVAASLSPGGEQTEELRGCTVGSAAAAPEPFGAGGDEIGRCDAQVCWETGGDRLQRGERVIERGEGRAGANSSGRIRPLGDHTHP